MKSASFTPITNGGKYKMFLEPIRPKAQRSGWIELISGSMFSGKTEEVLRRVRRSLIAGQEVVMIKPEIDARYSKKHVVSHDSNSYESIACKHAFDVLNHVHDQEVVAIDEAQFFDSALLDVVHELANRGKRVIVAGLSMGSQGKPFGAMPQIMATAEHITKLHAICAGCGEHAHFSKRIDSTDSIVDIGGKEKYQPLCRACYLKAEV